MSIIWLIVGSLIVFILAYAATAFERVTLDPDTERAHGCLCKYGSHVMVIESICPRHGSRR